MALCFLRSRIISMVQITPQNGCLFVTPLAPLKRWFFLGPITLSHILLHRNHKTGTFTPACFVDFDGINGKVTIPTCFYGSVRGYETPKLTKINQQIFGHSGAPSLLTIGKERITYHPHMACEIHICLILAHFHNELCRINPTWPIWVNHKLTTPGWCFGLNNSGIPQLCSPWDLRWGPHSCRATPQASSLRENQRMQKEGLPTKTTKIIR